MTGSEFQKSAMRTNDGKCTERLINKLNKHVAYLGKSGCVPMLQNIDVDLGGIFNASLGLSGEVGELNDMIKKWVFHEKELDIDHAKKEIGDILWYVAMMCESFGWNFDEIMQMNIDKLKARYPEGFDVELANNRKEGDI